MSSNSLSLRNVRDGIYNNLYLLNENGGLDDIRDLLTGGVTQEDINDNGELENVKDIMSTAEGPTGPRGPTGPTGPQ